MNLHRLRAPRPRLLPLLAAPALLVAVIGVVGTSGGGSDPEGGPATASAGTVSIEGFEFVPPEITVAPGTEVVWTNTDAAEHSIEDSGDLFPESEVLGQGAAFRFTYATAGTYPYICGIHSYMRGTVIVAA